MTTKQRALGMSDAKILCDILRRYNPSTCQFVYELLPLHILSLSCNGDKLSLGALATALLLAYFATIYSSLSSGSLLFTNHLLHLVIPPLCIPVDATSASRNAKNSLVRRNDCWLSSIPSNLGSLSVCRKAFISNFTISYDAHMTPSGQLVIH